MIARRHEPGLLPPLHGGHLLAKGVGQRGQTAKSDDDTQGRRVSPFLALPDDDVHTLNYARNVFAVNVDNETAGCNYAGVNKRNVSIGNALHILRGRSGLTMQQLATMMGYKNASSIQRYLTPEYGESGLLPIEIATKFAEALKDRGNPKIGAQDIYDLAGLEIGKEGMLRQPTSVSGMVQALSEQSAKWLDLNNLDALLQRGNISSLPIYGTALGADLDFVGGDGATVFVEHTNVDMTDAIDFVRRPPSLENRKDAYALIVAGNSMWPRFDDGDAVVVDSRRPLTPGDDVIVQLQDNSGQDGEARVVSALIKRLVRRSASYVELQQFNPPATFRLPTESIKAMHKIVTMSQILGQ